MKQGCRVTPGEGNLRESATEKSLPCCRDSSRKGSLGAVTVMVKRWGKSPPRTGQPGRYGKPHPEQCRIGALRGFGPTVARPEETSTGTLQPKARVGSLTALATDAAEEWSSMGGNPRDRIRLTGHPRISPKARRDAGNRRHFQPARGNRFWKCAKTKGWNGPGESGIG